jgi:hypothetical protein
MLLDAVTEPSLTLTLLPEPSPIASVDYLGEFVDSRVRIDKPHLSPSHLRDRQWCAAQNWFIRKHGLARDRSGTMIRGTSVHYGLSRAMQANRTTINDGRVHPISFENFLYIAQRDAYKKACSEMRGFIGDSPIAWDPRWQKGPKLDRQSLIYDVFRAIKTVAPYFYNDIYPIAVEAAFLIHWKRDDILPLLGVADIIDLRDDYRIGIRDVKTSIKRKTLTEVAFDRALVAYAGGMSQFLGIDVAATGYENITFTSPGAKAAIKKPIISHYTLDLPFEPPMLRTLELEAADAMLDLTDDRITPRRGLQTCVRCAFTEPCSKNFGPLHSYLLTPHQPEGDDTDG